MAEKKDQNELIHELVKKNQLLEAQINDLTSKLHELETRLAVIKDQKDKLIEKLREENQQLRDEVESLWFMLDEMTKTDVENWSSIFEKLDMDVASRALMVTKKKADC